MAARAKTRETPAPALDFAAVRRFHLGAPGAPAGAVPAGTVPAALQALRAPAPTPAPAEPPADPLALLRRILVESRRGAREAFAREARELAAQAELLLEAERRKTPEARDPGRLGTAMGSLGGRFVDASALSGVLGERRGGVPLPPARVQGLQEALELLREAAGNAQEADPPDDLPGLPGWGPVLVHNGTLPRLVAPLEVPPTAAGNGPAPAAGPFDVWTPLESSDPCRVAADLYDRKARAAARL
ncbi:MAG TPA: hypothetical protein VLF66_10860, partial [Thermoanaerobaculia bacterium]|nr:hypothetical protein [Thermoanaerobaculia bacterium]